MGRAVVGGVLVVVALVVGGVLDVVVDGAEVVEVIVRGRADFAAVELHAAASALTSTVTTTSTNVRIERIVSIMPRVTRPGRLAGARGSR